MNAIRLIAILFATALVAGCAGGNKGTEDPEASSPSSTVRVDEGNQTGSADQGSIEGVVKDDEEKVLEGVTIAVRELSVSATSDEAGAFAFTGVPVGTYTVDAAILGYSADAQKVDVLAGENSSVTFVLTRVVLVQSYNQTTILNGKITCGAVAVPWCGAPQDVGVDSPTNDRFAFNWTFDDVYPAYEIYEMVWTATAPGSSQTLSLLYLTSDEGIEQHVIFSSESGSPLRGEASRSALEAAHEDFPESDFGMGVYPPLDGVVIDQSFTIYRTQFYGEEPPKGWSYLSQIDG